MWTPLITELNNHQQFIISSHLNPDCDALGSELALAYHLISIGKDVIILNSDPIPSSYQFLDPDDLIQTYARKKHAQALLQADAIVIVDASGGWHRLGKVGKALSQIEATTICIDHHPDNQPFTNVSYVDPNVIATGELVYNLIMAMRGNVTPLMAQALYAAILTDSGNFRFPKTSPRTHQIIARLLECGVESAYVYSLLYEQFPLTKVHLKGQVLQNIQLTANGQIAYVGLSAHTLQKYEVLAADLDGFSNLAQQIAGVRVAILLIELPDGRVKLSLRSDGGVAVNTLAARFGGGGHKPAAGAIVEGLLSEVMQQVITAAKELLQL